MSGMLCFALSTFGFEHAIECFEGLRWFCVFSFSLFVWSSPMALKFGAKSELINH